MRYAGSPKNWTALPSDGHNKIKRKISSGMPEDISFISDSVPLAAVLFTVVMAAVVTVVLMMVAFSVGII